MHALAWALAWACSRQQRQPRARHPGWAAGPHCFPFPAPLLCPRRLDARHSGSRQEGGRPDVERVQLEPLALPRERCLSTLLVLVEAGGTRQ